MQLGKHWLMMSLFAIIAVTGPVQATDKTNVSRIVSIGGLVTEIIYMLGASDKIVAVDTTSVFPAEALQTKASVGYMRQISPEGVLSTLPDLVLAVEDAGPPQALEVLRESGIAFETVANPPTTDGVVAKIRYIGDLLGEQGRANAEIARIETDLARLKSAQGAIRKTKKVLFLLTAASDQMVAGGTGTTAAGIIELAGGENAIADFTGYKPVSAEAVLAMKPDAILIMKRATTRQNLPISPAIQCLPNCLQQSTMTFLPWTDPCCSASGRALLTLPGCLQNGCTPILDPKIRHLSKRLQNDFVARIQSGHCLGPVADASGGPQFASVVCHRAACRPARRHFNIIPDSRCGKPYHRRCVQDTFRRAERWRNRPDCLFGGFRHPGAPDSPGDTGWRVTGG